jgi:hypothetical protein
MEQALKRILELDPGLWLTSQDIAREALGLGSRWRGKGKTGVNLTSEEAQLVLQLIKDMNFYRGLSDIDMELKAKLGGEKWQRGEK